MLQVIGAYQEWLETLRSKYTRENYERHLKRFCAFANNTPDELAGLAPDLVRQLVVGYVIHMKKTAKEEAGKPVNGSICVNSIPIYMLGVQSYLDHMDVTLNWKRIKAMYPEAVSNNLRAYRREEIQKVLTFADIRDCLFVLIPSSSGIRAGALVQLKVRDLTRLEDGLGMIKVYGKSKHSRYISFVTPECMTAVDRYLKYRKEMGERVNDESPLIRDKFDPTLSLHNPVWRPKVNEPRFIKMNPVNRIMVKLLTRAGLSREELQPDHGLRRFFNTVCKNVGIDHMYKEKFMGHSVQLDDVYYDPEDPKSMEKMLSEYWKAVDELTINDENRAKKKVVELEREKQELDSRLDRIEAFMARNGG